MASKQKMALTFGKRLTLVIILMMLAMVGVLKIAEKSKDPLRLGLQDYLSEATKHTAEITELVEAKLFPNIIFAMKGIYIRDKDDPGRTLAKADTAYISLNFWSRFLGISNYEIFEIKGIETASGYVLPQKLSLNFFGITDPSPTDSPPALLIDGLYNERSLLITAEMRRHRQKPPFVYDFGPLFPVSFKLGETEVRGIFSRTSKNIGFAEIELSRAGEKAVFAADDILLSPLKITVKGQMDEVVFNGELTKNGDTMMFDSTITTSKKEDFDRVRSLMMAVITDLGLHNKPDILKWTITHDAREPEKQNDESQ